MWLERLILKISNGMTGKKLYTGIAVAAGLVVVGLFFFIMNGSFFNTQNPVDALEQTLSSGGGQVVIQEVRVGTGPAAKPGDLLQVNYIGKLQDGTVFDQSSAHGGPIQFVLGARQVIPGWEQGLNGMKVGGTRILMIPPSLAYGAQQVGPIPPNSTLIFQVELVSATPSSQPYAPEGPAAE